MLNLNNKRINWTNFKVLTLDNKRDVYFNNSEYGIGYTEISAEEYFRWAKQIVNKGDNITTRECVEVIANIKRCIDCKCESFLKNYGFIKDINSRNYPYLKDLDMKGDKSFISLISYLLDLNLIVVEEIRKLRNETEHDYTRPSFEEAERAVAVGELFLLAFNHKIGDIRYYCEIYSREKDSPLDIVLFRKGEDPRYSQTFIDINSNILLDSSSIEYVKILKILINGDFNNLPRIFNPKIPLEQIKYKEYFDEDSMYLDNSDEKF